MIQDYLTTSEIIDCKHQNIVTKARELADQKQSLQDIAKACFEWVRDEISHSCDYQMNPVTCRASDVLEFRTGYCYAKSHLLAALLRANSIPCGFCYQRLSVNDDGEPYSLHGFNAVYLSKFGWYRVDPRGNKPGVNAQFTPPAEQLAFQAQLSGEIDFNAIFSEPLPVVVEALQVNKTWDEMLENLPDVSQIPNGLPPLTRRQNQGFSRFEKC